MEVRPYRFGTVKGYAEPEEARYTLFLDEPSLKKAYGLEDYSPPIDFERDALIAAHLGPRPSAGHDVRIEGAERTPNGLVIRLRCIRPAPGAMTAAVITHPRAFALVDRAGWAEPAALRARGNRPLVVRFVDSDQACLASVTFRPTPV